jgi:hypothetical protein
MLLETCNWCEREIVDELPEESGPGGCGGLSCGHRTIYGLYNEDCRQVILRVAGDRRRGKMVVMDKIKCKH